MKAFRMYSIGQAGFDDVDEPTVLPGEAVVSVEAAGICGTDLHVLSEGVLTDPEKLPVTMGHEFVGRIVALGEQVPSTTGSPALRIGDRVVGEPLINCGTCTYCLRGLLNLCARWLHLGATRDGAWAEFVSVPVERLTRISEHVPTTHAVLAEPLACALHFIERAELKLGQSLLIVGGGPAGQLTLLAAKAAGIGPVIVSETSESRRALAEQLGAEATINPLHEDVMSVTQAHTGGIGVDAVIELAGTPGAVSGAFQVPRPGGTLLLAGICGDRAIPVDTNRVVQDEITVRGAFATRWQMPAAVQMLSRGNLNLDPVVSMQTSWLNLPAAMNKATSESDICKIVLEF